MTITRIPFGVAAVFLTLAVSAQEAQEKVDLQTVQKDLDHVFERPPGRVDVARVQERFAAFWKKYDGKDLGHLSHARGLSLYWNRERDKALAEFDKYLAKHDPAKIPSEEQRATIGRAYLSAAIQMTRAEKAEKIDAARFVDLAAKFARSYHDVASVGHYVTRNLGEEQAKLAATARGAMIRELARRKDLSAAQLDATVQALYEGGRKGRAPRPAPGRRPAAVQARPSRPTTIQPFTATAMSGREIDLKAYRGQVVLVDFWATWCRPCLREMPNVVKAHGKFKNSGFTVLGISLDKADAEDKIAATAKNYGMTWEQIYDGKHWSARLAKANGIRSIPSAFLIDRAGKVRFSGQDTRGPALHTNIQKLLDEKSKR